MSDSIQTVILFVIIILTVLLFALGIQVYYILREFRQTIGKANRILDDTETVAHSISEPVEMLSSLAVGLKTGSAFVNLFKKIIKGEKEEE